MTSDQAFNIVWGVKLHFSSLDYSVLKYGTNTKAAQGQFEQLTQAQRFKFEWLADRFKKHEDLIYASIGCSFDSVNPQFDPKQDIIDSYLKFKSRRDAMTYTISSDARKHELEDLSIDKLLFKYLVGKYSPEYMVVLCYNSTILQDFYNSPNLVWARENILKLIKYTDFVNIKKFLHLVPHHETATTC